MVVDVLKRMLWIGLGVFVLLGVVGNLADPAPDGTNEQTIRREHTKIRTEKITWLNGPGRYTKFADDHVCAAQRVTDETVQRVYGSYLYKDAKGMSDDESRRLVDNLTDVYINGCGVDPEVFWAAIQMDNDAFNESLMLAMVKEGRT